MPMKRVTPAASPHYRQNGPEPDLFDLSGEPLIIGTMPYNAAQHIRTGCLAGPGKMAFVSILLSRGPIGLHAAATPEGARMLIAALQADLDAAEKHNEELSRAQLAASLRKGGAGD